MKQLKPRDKVTQRMTRDGLTLDNQTTGESANISSREVRRKRYWNGRALSMTGTRQNRRPGTPER